MRPGDRPPSLQARSALCGAFARRSPDRKAAAQVLVGYTKAMASETEDAELPDPGVRKGVALAVGETVILGPLPLSLSMPIETPTTGRGVCSRMTVSPTSRWRWVCRSALHPSSSVAPSIGMLPAGRAAATRQLETDRGPRLTGFGCRCSAPRQPDEAGQLAPKYWVWQEPGAAGGGPEGRAGLAELSGMVGISPEWSDWWAQIHRRHRRHPPSLVPSHRHRRRRHRHRLHHHRLHHHQHHRCQLTAPPPPGRWGVEYWWVISVYVAPAHRRKGLATRLLKAVLAEAASRGAQTVNLRVERANTAAQVYTAPLSSSLKSSPIAASHRSPAAAFLGPQALYRRAGFAVDDSHLVMAHGRTPSGELIAVGGAGKKLG